jgi:hypothetical protein
MDLKSAEDELKGILGLDVGKLEYKIIVADTINKVEKELVKTAIAAINNKNIDTVVNNLMTLNKLSEQVSMV